MLILQWGAATSSCSYSGKGEKELPTDIPSNCTRVFLSGYSISHLPSGVLNHLTQCIFLYIRYNELSAIDERAFLGLGNLQELDLGDNQIKQISDGTFTGLSSLEELNLRYSQVEIIENGAFKGLTNLENLHLENNKIKEIPNDAFMGLDNLQRLYLSENQIRMIHHAAFSRLKSLQVLVLSDNDLQVVEQNLFVGNRNLKMIQMDKNPISNINDGAFNGLYSLQSLSLGGNQMKSLDSKLLADIRRPLSLKLTLQSYELVFLPYDDLWDCETLCWLKKEEQSGTISFALLFDDTGSPVLSNLPFPIPFNPLGSPAPKCASGTWNSLQCSPKGEYFSF